MAHVLENNIAKTKNLIYLISNGKQDETTMCASTETISWIVDQLSTLLIIDS